MKTLLFLCGPNGIGKTTICREIVKALPHSAYVDSDPCRMMNPFVLDDETIPTIAANISGLILNYFHCPVVQTVVFSYGLHGRRREVFERVMGRAAAFPHRFIPFLLWCGEEETVKRMNLDHRSVQRMERAMNESRKAFDGISYPRIDISKLSAAQAARTILTDAELLDGPTTAWYHRNSNDMNGKKVPYAD